MNLGQVIWPFTTEAKTYEKFSVVPFDFTLSANETKTQNYQISSGWNFVLSIINSFSTGAFKLQISDRYESQDFFISPARGELITGEGKNPFIIPKLHNFRAGNTITVSVTNLTGVANSVSIALVGHKEELSKKKLQALQGGYGDTFEDKRAEVRIDGDIFIVDKLQALVFDFSMAGGTYEQKYPVSTGQNFMWEIINSYHGATAPRDFTLQIRDELLNEDFFISPIRSSVITGDGKNPFVLPRSYMFQGGTNVAVSITDTDPLGASVPVQVVMIGYRVVRA